VGCLSKTPADYIGRFAPSPSGELHFGSLLAAVAGFLDARSHKGQWLLRIEDLDPAREPPQAAGQILRILEAFQLHWDGPVLYQSQRRQAYEEALEQLSQLDLVYPCNCSRQRIKSMGGIYDGRCRDAVARPRKACALRLQVPDRTIRFDDLIQGPQRQQLLSEAGDFVIVRKDGLFAYQLAVVVDDSFQHISHIVRGWDLLNSTPRQIYLQNVLNLHRPVYAHIPIAVNEQGQKLSKQHFAAPIQASEASRYLHQALLFLGQNPAQGLADAPPSEQLTAALECWDIQAVPKLANIPI
jgi:glutamyl-Q tRNA(Asp) synthetase